MIEIKNISFSYDKYLDQDRDKQKLTVKAVSDCSLHIYPGEWLTLIGANGSGKSTLAKHLNGLLLPSKGQVLVDGWDTRDQEHIYDIRQKVAFVFQNPDNQIVANSVEEDIAFGPENLGLDSDEINRRIEKALDITGLREVRSKEPYLLSGGEKQRLAIAGALAMSSRYLVLDEPTSMLDPQMRRQVISTLQYLHREIGMAIIYITNIMEEALLAERVVIMQDGMIAAQGNVKEIFSQERSMAGWGLALPPICRLSSMLADAGYEQVRGAATIDEIMEVLCT
ncbi:MAG: energy-coupling factor transporter ATPase [Bacillota bacterium]|jgi:energy-coupling factor transport system ATP-binding protein